jgi:hypothetical protein
VHNEIKYKLQLIKIVDVNKFKPSLIIEDNKSIKLFGVVISRKIHIFIYPSLLSYCLWLKPNFHTNQKGKESAKQTQISKHSGKPKLISL